MRWAHVSSNGTAGNGRAAPKRSGHVYANQSLVWRSAVNDIVCLVMTPLALRMARRLGLPPIPYVVAVATASNIGSTATITGNPQNMLIGSLSGIAYIDFIGHELALPTFCRRSYRYAYAGSPRASLAYAVSE